MTIFSPNVTPALRSMSLVQHAEGERAELIYELHAELDVARARLGVEALLNVHQATSAQKAKATTAVSELAWNALKYGGGGVLCAWVETLAHRRRFTLIVADEGPGIKDISWALSDKQSSGGSLGLGLPGTKRMMDELWIRSPLKGLGYGTSVEAKLWVSYE